MSKIRVAICGYGNLGKGVELAVSANSDMELVAVFTRRNPADVHIQTDVPVISMNEISEWKNDVDVLIMCGGSATDLPEQVPVLAEIFNTVDSFDTHAKIPTYFDAVNSSAIAGGKVSIISVGWDPGLFSLNRLYADSILSNPSIYTFWGKGVSQGHSDAIRRIAGVKNAVQYTIPVEEAMSSVRNGENPELTTREKHTRECFVVAEDGANLEEIEHTIKTMPNYFADYDTTVHFVSEEELKAKHSGMPHGGSVICSANTNAENTQVIEYSLTLDSNPEFTGSVLVAYARAAYRLYTLGTSGAKTIFDIAPALLSQKSPEEMLGLL